MHVTPDEYIQHAQINSTWIKGPLSKKQVGHNVQWEELVRKNVVHIMGLRKSSFIIISI